MIIKIIIKGCYANNSPRLGRYGGNSPRLIKYNYLTNCRV